MLRVLPLVALLCAVSVRCTSLGEGQGTPCSPAEDHKEAIRLLTLLPYFNPIPALNPSWDQGDNVRPAIDLAVDQINNSTRILGNYTLELVHGRDGCGVVTETAEGFVEQAFVPERTAGFTGVIGPGCSSSTTLLAPVVNATELSLVSLHGGGSPILSERTRYPLHLGTLGSTVNFVRGLKKLMAKAGWQKIALFYDDSRLYYLTTKELLLKDIPPDTSILYKPVSFTFLPLNIIRQQLHRIVFVMCPSELTRRIMCLAVNRSMIYPDYQFVIMSQVLEDVVQPISFVYDRVQYNCSEAEMQSAFDKMMLLHYNLVPEEGEELESGITYVEYLDQYRDYRERYNQCNQPTRNSTYTLWATYFYDSVWAWALVLDNLTKSDVNFTINADYGSLTQSRVLVEQFYRTSFRGISGKISFSRESGYSLRKVNFSQVSANEEHLFGIVSGDGHLALKSNLSLTFTPDSFQNATIREDMALAIFFTIVSGALISATVFLHILTIVYRKRPSIKAASPKLLHLSYIGVYIILFGSFLWSLNPAAAVPVERRPIFCTLLWTWCMPLGFTFVFCPIALRTWRIYRIFKHYLNPGKLISDPVLLSVLAFIVLVDLLVSITWTTVDIYVTQTRIFVMPVTGAASVVGVRLDCYCEYLFVWFAISFAYKLLIIFTVTLFAFLTRKIAINSFATTSLRVLVFLLAIVIPLGVSVYLLIVNFELEGPRGYASFITLFLFLDTIGVLCVVCIFIPPLVPVFKKYKNKIKVIRSITSTTSTINTFIKT